MVSGPKIVSMRRSKGLMVCRLLVAVLLLNTAAPLFAQVQPSTTGQAMLCTSAGLIRASLIEQDDRASSQLEDEFKCIYCQFSDQSSNLTAIDLPYPQPDSDLQYSYQGVLLTPLAMHMLNHVQLRAPPIS